jgi:hypothetical protein
MTIDKTTELPPEEPSREAATKVPSSGRGADSALKALIKRRLPRLEEPLPGGEGEAPAQ